MRCRRSSKCSKPCDWTSQKNLTYLPRLPIVWFLRRNGRGLAGRGYADLSAGKMPMQDGNQAPHDAGRERVPDDPPGSRGTARCCQRVDWLRGHLLVALTDRECLLKQIAQSHAASAWDFKALLSQARL